MSDRRLLILDAYDADVLRQVTSGGRWDVLLLGRSEPWFRALTPNVPHADAHLQFLDPARFAARAIEQVRDFVLERIARLPDVEVDGQPLRLALANLGTSWWHTETSELGPYRTPLIFQLYELALADGAIRSAPYAEVVVASPRRWMRDVFVDRRDAAIRVVRAAGDAGRDQKAIVRYLRHAFGAVVSLISIRAAAVAGQWPRVTPARGAACVFTFYPAWWSVATERFFPAPPADVAFLGWFHAPGRLWRRVSDVRRTIAERRIVVLQRFVPWRAALSLLSPLRFWRTLRLLRSVSAGGAMPFCGVDVRQLVADDISRSLTGGEQFQSDLIKEAAACAARQLAPDSVVYRAEFQPAERALVAALRGVSRSVGFVHYPFGRNYLPIWNTHTDQPLPDGILTCGDAGRAHVVEAGYPAGRVGLCGPQRHLALAERVASPRDRAALRGRFGVDERTPLFLVAPAIIEADTEALFAALIGALDDFGPCRVVVRTHPNRPEGDAALARSVTLLGPSRVAIAPQNASLYDVIQASDAMITIGSTVAFEAMALGVMPVVFENPSTYAATSLRAFIDALYVVHDTPGLRHALQDIRAGAAPAASKREHWRQTVTRVLGDMVTPLPEQLDHAVAGLDRAERMRR